MRDISRWCNLSPTLVLFISWFNGSHHAGLSSSFFRLSPEVKYQLTVKYFKELPPQTNRWSRANQCLSWRNQGTLWLAEPLIRMALYWWRQLTWVKTPLCPRLSSWWKRHKHQRYRERWFHYSLLWLARPKGPVLEMNLFKMADFISQLNW